MSLASSSAVVRSVCICMLKRGVLKRTCEFNEEEGPEKGLRFRHLRGRTLAFKKGIAIGLRDLEASRGAMFAFRSLAFKKRGFLRLRC